MRPFARVLFVVALMSVSVVAVPVAANADVYSCDEAGLDQALADGGGPHFFDCVGPTEILLSEMKAIDTDVILEGGHNLILSGQDSHRHFVVSPGVTAELHEIVFVEGFSTGDGGAIKSNGVLLVGGSEFIGNHAGTFGGAIYNGFGSLVVGDSYFEGNTSFLGGAIGSRSSAVVGNSHFVGNHAESSGGAVGHYDGPLQVTGAHFENNTAPIGGAIFIDAGLVATVDESGFDANSAQNGGAIAVHSDSILEISRSHFGGNSVLENGGAILAEPDVTLQLSFSHVEGNHAGLGGGGVFADGAYVAAFDSGFFGNHADLQGGAMMLVSGNGGTLATSFEGNTVGGQGGAVTVIGGAFELIWSSFVNNHAEGRGGAFGVEAAEVYITESTISGNSALSGGGISIEDGLLELTGVEMTNNQARSLGGGLFNWGSSTALVVDSFLADNHAGDYGGAINNTAELTIRGTLMVGNHAGETGGAIDSTGGLLDVDDSAILYNSADVTGGGVWSIGDTYINQSCIEGNTDTAVLVEPTANVTGNWWGSDDGPSGPTGAGSGDSLEGGVYGLFAGQPLGPCLFAQAPWDPGRPSSGVCEVLVWFDEVTVLSDTEPGLDHWAITGAARFFDADEDRDRETAVIGITDFYADAGETVVLEQQWRTELWSAFGDQIRFDDLGLTVYEFDVGGNDRGTASGSPNLVFGCGETFSLTALVGVHPLAGRGQVSDDSTGVLELHMTITTVDTWMPPAR